jgi:16S rRNA pseudouridine516 synthase
VARIDHLLARNLAVSRAEARRLLAAGCVTDEQGAPFRPSDPAPATVRVEGQPLHLHEHYHLMLNKPAGCLTALSDARQPVAYALLREAPLHAELRPVGRLDLDTTGLLIWTTDGQWLHRLTHPRRAVPRIYQAALARAFRPPPPDLELADGHRPQIQAITALDEAALHPALLRPADAAAFAGITIVGGAYHEVRRIFAALGSHVLALCRVQFGRLALPVDLGPGASRPIEPDQV